MPWQMRSARRPFNRPAWPRSAKSPPDHAWRPRPDRVRLAFPAAAGIESDAHRTPEHGPRLHRCRPGRRPAASAQVARAAAQGGPETIKWNAPFYVEPRFLFSFSAHKAHLDFAPSQDTLEAFGDELAGHRTTKNYLQVAYDEPLPEDLIRRMAEHRVAAVAARSDDSFW